jgi:hypothetical protein
MPPADDPDVRPGFAAPSAGCPHTTGAIANQGRTCGYRHQRGAPPAVVSSVWQTRHRVLCQQLEQWAHALRDAPPPATPAEHTVRLLTFAVTLLEQHRVNKRGQCQFCGWSRWPWRFWRRRPRCTVCRALAFALHQSLDVVWWQLLGSTGKQCSLADVREWLRQREQN